MSSGHSRSPGIAAFAEGQSGRAGRESIEHSRFAVGNSKGQGGVVGFPGYCSSKAALNMLTVIAAVELKGTRVKVNCCSSRDG